MSDTKLSLIDIKEDPLALLNADEADRRTLFEALFDDPEHVELAAELATIFEQMFRLMDADEEEYDKPKHFDLFDRLKAALKEVAPLSQRAIYADAGDWWGNHPPERMQFVREMSVRGGRHPVWLRFSFGDEAEGDVAIWETFLEWAEGPHGPDNPPPVGECAYCGTLFLRPAKAQGKKYCSESCRQMAYQKRKAENH